MTGGGVGEVGYFTTDPGEREIGLKTFTDQAIECGEQFAVLQCAPSFDDYAGCEVGGWVDHLAPADGRFTTTVRVRDRYPDEFGEATVDCRATPCIIGLWRMVEQDAVLAVRAGIAFTSLPLAPTAEPTSATPAFTG